MAEIDVVGGWSTVITRVLSGEELDAATIATAVEVIELSPDKSCIVARDVVYERPAQENIPSLHDVSYKGRRMILYSRAAACLSF